jgi:hypothetical protein
MSKQITNATLATMIARGFEHTATKQELKDLRVLTETIAADLKLVRDDVRDLKYGRVAQLEERLERVEKKVGLAE